MKEKEIWDYLINKANEVKSKRIISPFIEEGQVAAAILTKNGNVFTGVCIDINDNLYTPCGACRELLMQLGKTQII